MAAQASSGVTHAIKFEAVAHEYRVDGIVRPSVTQAIKAVGIINPEWYTEAARARGSAVHAACHYLDEGDLAEETVAPELRGYLDAWMRFKGESKFQPLQMETMVFHRYLGYCGQFDRTAKLNGMPEMWMLDIKTGGREDWHRIQSAAYVSAISDQVRVYRRGCVYLRSNGSYSLVEHERKNVLDDMNDFRAALRVMQLQNKGGR